MARYRYSALLEDGRLARGHIEAASESLVVQRLAAVRQHAIDVEVDDGVEWLNRVRPGGRPRSVEVTLFTRQLAWLLKAGVPLSRALELLAASQKAAFGAVVADLRTAVRAGGSFADALSRHAELFTREYANMVRMAEASGTLTAVLNRIADSRDRRMKIRRKIQSALLYPAILVVVAVASLAIILTVVVPKLHAMFAGQDARLPPSTRILLSTSDWLLAHGGMLMVFLAAASAGALMAVRRPAIRERLKDLAGKLPLLGPVRRNVIAAEFCRTLAMLGTAGVGLLPSLELFRDGVNQRAYRETIGAMAASLRKADDYLKPMEDSRLFPELVPKMLRIAEETGNIVPILEQMTEIFEQEFETKTERLLTMLEPMIIVALSAMVGLIMITVLNGIVSINDLAG